MDFDNAINPDTDINAVSSVVFSPTGPTATGLAKSADARAALFTLGNITTGTTYTVTVTVTTTDGQTIPVTGTLKVQ